MKCQRLKSILDRRLYFNMLKQKFRKDCVLSLEGFRCCVLNTQNGELQYPIDNLKYNDNKLIITSNLNIGAQQIITFC